MGFLCSEITSNKLLYANVQHPVAIDSRIKTLVYSPNDIFQIKFAVGYQSIIELEENEEIELIAFGDPIPWNIKVLNHRLFIKAIDPGIRTNMTIVTTKRTYLTEISSSDFSDDSVDDQLTYVAKFFYPELDVDATRPFHIRQPNIDLPLSPIGDEDIIKSDMPTNYLYTFSGTSSIILPIRVFDDGKKTYMQFPSQNEIVPAIYAVAPDGRERRLKTHLEDDYVVVDTIEYQFSLRWDKELICIFNEALLRSFDGSVEYK